MTLDKNGKTIKAGDIVEITGAYFKCDNGFWYVEEDGTNKAYNGKGLTMQKIGKTGKISKAKYNICFWPLVNFVSSDEKSRAARKHNEKHAQIEVTDKINNSQVIAAFEERLDNCKFKIAHMELHEEHEDCIRPYRDVAEYLETALARLKA